MESFIVRKKRKLSDIQSPLPGSSAALTTPEDESTDFKLTLLSSLRSDLDQAYLLDVLLAHDGLVDEAAASLRTVSPSKKPAATGYQSSLSSFATSSRPEKKIKLLSKKGKTLHLYSPEDVEAHTPCTIIHNFLPPVEANDLLEELLAESLTFGKMSFKLFDNVVESPHTMCFYVESLEEERRQRTEYIYNGKHIDDVRQLTPLMQRASPKVRQAVNSQIDSYIKTHYPSGRKLKYQSPDPWQPNAAIVNCYANAAESVGYHSDQLTYLGPRAVIGSLSLGVAREFRVRRIVPRDPNDGTPSAPGGIPTADAQGQIAIHLPHNSLLVMHANMQEEWKHCIAPAQSIDPHPIAGTKRINITYRSYKPELHPSKTPRCNCGVPTVLRVVQRKKESRGKYFWMCYAGSAPGKGNCEFFQWARFDDDGNPIWG